MPSKGRRQAITVRLPYDDYREAAIRARGRGWSMSDYIGYCVAVTIGSRKVKRVTEPKLVNVRSDPDE